MKWKIIKKIFDSKKNNISWMKSHAWVPTVINIKNNSYRVFFASRNYNNLSQVGAFTINIDNFKVSNLTKKPVLEIGDRGYFDDSAVLPCHVIKVKNFFLMYYVGWTQGKTVPYMASIGVAKSKSLFSKFKKISKAPIIGRSEENPIFTASCFVEKENKKFIMYYTSNNMWKIKRGNFIPKYNIKKAISTNGINNWKFFGDVINLKKTETAITRPWIIKLNDKKYMFYSYRGKNYKVGLAEKNKKSFKRINEFKLKIEPKYKNELNIMHEYACVFKNKNEFFMLLNGNNFGENGIFLAKKI